jgi:hypothetical protein
MTTFLLSILYIFLCAFTFRVRGGLRIPFTDKKFPLNKWWFAAWIAVMMCIYVGWSAPYFFTLLIAGRMASQIAGWGEAVGCALGVSKPNPDRYDYYDFDEFCDNFEIKERDIKIWKWTIHIPHYKLIDHPVTYGVVWLTLRGLLFTFLIGLALNSIPYMLWGAPMGLIYWFAGWVNRHIRDDGKSGWYRAEWLFGGYLGIGLVLYGLGMLSF